MSKNWPLLIKTAEHIIDHPESWDQAWFFLDCGTQACFAGWAVMLEGYKPVDGPTSSIVELTDTQIISLRGYGVDLLWGGSVVGASELAAHLLGLTDREADDLYHGANDLIDILTKLDEWAFADGQELSRKLYEKLEELLDAAAAKDGF